MINILGDFEMINNKISEFFISFGTHKNMVLSTAANNEVHSRMMSIVCFEEKFYFQTDENFNKCCDIEVNCNVSLCIDNISIEGLCSCIGKPAENKKFCEIFKTAFPKSYELYTNLENEVLYEIVPQYIKLWQYENNEPYIKIYDIKSREIKTEKYLLDK